MALDFPSNPSNNQIYTDVTTGNRYKYHAPSGSWEYSPLSLLYGLVNTHVLFNDSGSLAGNTGLTFDAGANTLTANTINAYSMRVTGNLYIGSNTVTISNNVIHAEMLNVSTVMVNGSAIPTGDQSNAMYVVANAAFGHTNTTLIHSQAVYDSVNSAFGVINSAFTQSNTDNVRLSAAYTLANAAFEAANAEYTFSNNIYAAVNSAFGVINAAFASANNVAPQVAPAFNTANAAFDLANTKFSSSGGTVTGSVSIVGDLVISGNTRQIGADTLRVSDPLIYLAGNNYSSDIVDIGFIANYVNTGGANVHTGLYREHENKEYYLFQGYAAEPLNNHIGAFSNNMTLAVLNADVRTSNLNLGGANAIVWIKSAYDTVNAAYTSSNADYVLTNAAYTSINAGYTVANAAFGVANTVTNYLPLSGGTMTGALNIGTGTNLSFGAATRQMINLFNTDYAIGIQNNTQYYRSSLRFSWHRGGVHSGTENDPGTGGTVAMTLDSSSHLTAFGSMRSPIFYDSDNTAFYVNPASTSVLSDLTVGGSAVVPKIAATYTLGNDPNGTSGATWGWDNAIGAGLFNLYAGATSTTYTGARGAARLGLHDNSFNFYVSPLAASGGQANGTSLTWTHLASWSTGGMYMYYNIYTPILYDSNNTAFYADLAGTDWGIFSAGGGRFRNIQISSSTFTDTIQNVTSGSNLWLQYGHNGPLGLCFGGGTTTAYGQLNITAPSGGWDSRPTVVVASNGDGYLQTRHIRGKNTTGTGTDNLYVNWDGLADLWNGRHIYSYNYYDRNDTAFYVDANGLTRLNRLYIEPRNDNYFVGSMNNVNGLANWQSLTDTRGQWTVTQYNEIGNYTNSPSGIYQYGAVMSWRTENHSFQLYASHTGGLSYKTQWNNDNYSGWLFPVVYGRNESSTSIYSSIIYDSNDTNYRCDPNGTNVLATLEVGGLGKSSSHCIGSNLSGAIAWNNSQLEIRNTNGGNVGVAWHRAGYTSVALYHGAGSELRCSGNLFGDTDVRSPIFYDSNDTVYYVNPNDVSRLLITNINYLRGSRTINSAYDSGNNLLETPAGIEIDSGKFIRFTNGVAPFSLYRTNGDMPAPYGIGWTNGGESSGIFQRLASNGGSFGEMIFSTSNDGAGSFAFRRGTWEGTAFHGNGSNHYGTLLASIDWGGNFVAIGNITAYFSDKRLKTDIKPISNAIEKIKAISGITYRNNELAKSFGYKDEEEQVGVLAQDVEKVMPQVVKLAPFDCDNTESNRPRVSKTGENYKTVMYDKLVPLLIEAIKEQQAQIDELKRRFENN